jgi:hypothetical protein
MRDVYTRDSVFSDSDEEFFANLSKEDLDLAVVRLSLEETSTPKTTYNRGRIRPPRRGPQERELAPCAFLTTDRSASLATQSLDFSSPLLSSQPLAAGPASATQPPTVSTPSAKVDFEGAALQATAQLDEYEVISDEEIIVCE